VIASRLSHLVSGASEHIWQHREGYSDRSASRLLGRAARRVEGAEEQKTTADDATQSGQPPEYYTHWLPPPRRSRRCSDDLDDLLTLRPLPVLALHLVDVGDYLRLGFHRESLQLQFRREERLAILEAFTAKKQGEFKEPGEMWYEPR